MDGLDPRSVNHSKDNQIAIFQCTWVCEQCFRLRDQPWVPVVGKYDDHSLLPLIGHPRSSYRGPGVSSDRAMNAIDLIIDVLPCRS